MGSGDAAAVDIDAAEAETLREQVADRFHRAIHAPAGEARGADRDPLG